MEVKTIQERKKLLLDKLEVLKKAKISDSVFSYPCRNGAILTIDTKLSKGIHGILSGEFITTYCWDGSLNLCVGICKSPDVETRDQSVLYFLIEGNNGLTGFNYEGQCLTTFAELKLYAAAEFV